MAGALTTVAFVPQVAQAWKTKSTRDISAVWLLLLCSGIVLWFTYGVLLRSAPIIVTNGVTFLLIFSLLVLKLRHH